MKKNPTSLRLAALACAVLGAASWLRAQPAPAAATLLVHADQSGPVINRNIYGQFSEHLGHCIYEGIWVGENSPIPNTKGYRNDVLAALKNLQVPILRWPGGCFADEYHWRDGIGPRESRPAMINTHWGGVVENNHFGTHEFLGLCEMLGIEPYVCVNVGSGTVQEAMEWVEYMTSDAQSPMANLRRKNGREQPWKVRYIAVGNESWGCGGNMTPAFYADNFRRYNTFIKNYRPGEENRIQRIACGPNGDNYDWTETLMKNSGTRMQGDNWRNKTSATEFDEPLWMDVLHRTLRMEELIAKHSAIMDKYDAQKKVGLVVDEWGTWYDVERGTNPGFLFQQNTLRDALVAALNLHIFHQHADRVTMANIAQIVNVLQAMILTDKEKMILTPTYHVFEMFKPHQGATALPVELTTPDYVLGENKIPAVSASASRAKDGKVHVSFANCDPNKPVVVECKLAGIAAKSVSGRVLTADAMNAHNTFAAPNSIAPKNFDGAQLDGDTLRVTLPAKSVAMVELN